MAGVGKGSGLLAAKGVGSAGRGGITPLDESFGNLFEGRPSPGLLISGRLHIGRLRLAGAPPLSLPPVLDSAVRAESRDLEGMV